MENANVSKASVEKTATLVVAPEVALERIVTDNVEERKNFSNANVHPAGLVLTVPFHGAQMTAAKTVFAFKNMASTDVIAGLDGEATIAARQHARTVALVTVIV